jgi:hypothetical protein
VAASRIVAGRQPVFAGRLRLAVLASGGLGVALVLAALHGGIDSAALTEGVLYLLPAMLLALVLLAGRRPGERLIVALHRRRARRGGQRGSTTPGLVPAHPTELALPRGGRLIAAALAGRAPPAWAATNCF